MTNTIDTPVSGVEDTVAEVPKRWRRLRRWARNALIVVLTVTLIGVVAGQIQKARLSRMYPAPGELVRVGDRNVHVLRSGQGPTVVFENGPGGIGVDWTLVATEASRFATTIAYDRAGLGWSEPSVGPRDIATLVAELKQTLEGAEAPAPYVLVGHSYGGLIVRAYAYTYPEDVAALVLVDAAHEDQLTFYPEEYAAKAQTMGEMMGRLRWLYRAVVGSGIPALFHSSFAPPVTAQLPPDLAAARAAVAVVDSSQAVTSTDEMSSLMTSFDHVRKIRRYLDETPVRVITHGRPAGSEAGVPAGLEEEVEAAWQAMQRDLLTISTDARMVVAEESGHDIHVGQPDLIVDMIREVLDR
jgi:pimeloyl-ACP methyl ester carboxylesterase